MSTTSTPRTGWFFRRRDAIHSDPFHCCSRNLTPRKNHREMKKNRSQSLEMSKTNCGWSFVIPEKQTVSRVDKRKLWTKRPSTSCGQYANLHQIHCFSRFFATSSQLFLFLFRIAACAPVAVNSQTGLDQFRPPAKT